MGRPAGRFTAAKTFTLDIMTLEWLNRTCLERKMKASALLTEIIEKYRISLKGQPYTGDTRPASCDACDAWTPHTIDMVCTECNTLNKRLKTQINEKRHS